MSDATSGTGVTAPFDQPTSDPARDAVANLYNSYLTGLMLTLVSRRDAESAAHWVFLLFRHQHHEKFLASFDKLGLSGMPHAVACAAYHYLANRIGGVSVEFVRESDNKAWVHFVPPRWIYPGAAICGIPSAVSRAMLSAWYAHNGVSLGNPRLGFVCTAQTVDAQHGLAGYFYEYDHELSAEQRLQFRPGELVPPFDAAAAPALPDGQWPVERLQRARLNYAMEYIRSGLPRLAEYLGPAEAAFLGHLAAHQVAAQSYHALAVQFGIAGDRLRDFVEFLRAWCAIEGDALDVEGDDSEVVVTRHGWRVMRGLSDLSPAVFSAWNGLVEGALAVHNRFLDIECVARPRAGDDDMAWRISVRR